jgi:hypothetical protein
MAVTTIRLPFGAPGDFPPCIRQRPFGIAPTGRGSRFASSPHSARWNAADCAGRALAEGVSAKVPSGSGPSALLPTTLHTSHPGLIGFSSQPCTRHQRAKPNPYSTASAMRCTSRNHAQNSGDVGPLPGEQPMTVATVPLASRRAVEMRPRAAPSTPPPHPQGRHDSETARQWVSLNFCPA